MADRSICFQTMARLMRSREKLQEVKMSGRISLLLAILCCGTWAFAQAAPSTSQGNEAGGSPQPGAMNTEEGTPGMATVPNTTLPNADPSMPDRYHPNHPPTGTYPANVTAPGTNPGQSSHSKISVQSNGGKQNNSGSSGKAKSANAAKRHASTNTQQSTKTHAEAASKKNHVRTANAGSRAKSSS